jgi:hypothetical protein
MGRVQELGDLNLGKLSELRKFFQSSHRLFTDLAQDMDFVSALLRGRLAATPVKDRNVDAKTQAYKVAAHLRRIAILQGLAKREIRIVTKLVEQNWTRTPKRKSGIDVD